MINNFDCFALTYNLNKDKEYCRVLKRDNCNNCSFFKNKNKFNSIEVESDIDKYRKYKNGYKYD